MTNEARTKLLAETCLRTLLTLRDHDFDPVDLLWHIAALVHAASRNGLTSLPAEDMLDCIRRRVKLLQEHTEVSVLTSREVFDRDLNDLPDDLKREVR